VSEDQNVASQLDEHAALMRSIFTQWQQGQQEPAASQMQVYVDEHPGEQWALNFLLWLCQQQGEPGYRRGVPYAQAAASSGDAWVARQFAITLLSNAGGWPDLAEPAFDLFRMTAQYASGIDTAGIAWNLLSHGRDNLAAQVIEMPLVPFPISPEQWRAAVTDAEGHKDRLRQAASAIEAIRAEVQSLAATESQEIERIRTELSTNAGQAGVLIDSVSAGTINSRFESDAESNKKESSRAFTWGLVVLVLAAVVTALPLVLHYVGLGREYTGAQLLGAHVSATLALGAVAGVLLTRARHRDRARQRANDLATAMGTIIVYSNQIQDQDEKQRFMQTMGQLVLVAHLQADQTGGDQTSVSLPSLLSALRTPQS